ncbi:hypothetical protein LCGC14_2482690 [marine sediment metagenome]|uniref:Uncharacterized protein n=1 Tax=marine sediment metagenome TaxID=412755 RepID=A0A0F9B7Z8_9ZZZZ
MPDEGNGSDLTPIEKLRKSNDDLHEAVDEVLASEEYDVEKKCAFATYFSETFARINLAYKALGEEGP